MKTTTLSALIAACLMGGAPLAHAQNATEAQGLRQRLYRQGRRRGSQASPGCVSKGDFGWTKRGSEEGCPEGVADDPGARSDGAGSCKKERRNGGLSGFA